MISGCEDTPTVNNTIGLPVNASHKVAYKT